MSARPKLLVIDDREEAIELMHHFLRDYDYATRCELEGPCWSCPERPGCRLTHAHDLVEAEASLARHRQIDVVLLDVAFELPESRLVPSKDPDLDRRRRLQGLDILAALRRRRADLPVILMSAREDLLDEGAADSVAADELVAFAGRDGFDARSLGLLIERVLSTRRAMPGVSAYVWGDSRAMAPLRRQAAMLARTSLPVLLRGETGTGKSALAERVLHPASRRSGPFVSLDLSTMPSTLVASELFGTARGAYSGAVDRPGRIEAAAGGTLFLDEIGHLPLEVQRLLLCVLEDRRVTRLGELTPRIVDFRLVAATNADLEAAVNGGSFRADLLARLNPSATLLLPPLRQRTGDLPALLSAFAQRAFAGGADRELLLDYARAAELSGSIRAELALGSPPSEPTAVTFVVSPRSLRALEAHPWPGNVRELELLVGSAMVFALSEALTAAERRTAAAEVLPRLIPISDRLIADLLGQSGRLAARVEDLALRLEPHRSLHQVARSLERQTYERLFEESEGDFRKMARRLTGQDSALAARKVRLRFNQLGLSARSSRRSRS